MGLKGWAVAVALVLLGGFIFMSHLERMRVTEVGKKKTPEERRRTAKKRRARRTSLGPDQVKALMPYKEELEKACKRDLASASGALPKAWRERPASSPARDRMATAYACEALAAKDPQRCAPLGSIARHEGEKGAGMRLREACARDYFAVRSVVAGMRGEPDAKETCMASFTGIRGVKSRMLSNVCDVVVRAFQEGTREGRKNRGEGPLKEYMKYSAGVCSLAKPFTKADKDGFVENCMAFGAGLVDPKKCNALRDGSARLTCLERSATFWAVMKQDPKPCEGSDLCLAATTGSTERCRAVREEAAKYFCRADSRVRLRAMLQEEMKLRWDYGLPKFKPGDPFLHRLPPEEKKRVIAEQGTRKPEEVEPPGAAPRPPGAGQEARLPEGGDAGPAPPPERGR